MMLRSFSAVASLTSKYFGREGELSQSSEFGHEKLMVIYYFHLIIG